MKKILFVIAMQKEATKIAKELTLKQITENQYSRDNITLIITGVGKQQTAMSLVSYLENNKDKIKKMFLSFNSNHLSYFQIILSIFLSIFQFFQQDHQ